MKNADTRCPFVTILLPAGVGLSGGAARLLASHARLRRGALPWDYITAEEYCGRGATLLFVRPATGAHLADYALPFIHKYFTD